MMTPYQTKVEAIIAAHKVAKTNGYCYAFAIPSGWLVSDRKPLLGSGKIIECRDDGKEYLA